MKKRDDTWDGVFADPEVGRVLKSKGLIADANKSSIEELSQITTLNPSGDATTGYFYNNTVITKFPELRYCTGLSDMIGGFYGCSSLTEVGRIPEGVTNMRWAFSGCSSLTDAPTIPDSVIEVRSLFSGCSNIVNAPTISERVTDMSWTFRYCTKLDGIFIIRPSTPPTYLNTFQNVNVRTIYVPDGSVSTYKSASGWSAHSSIIYPISELPE